MTVNIFLKTYASVDNLHHAYLIEGKKDVCSLVEDFLNNDFSFSTRGNPDFWIEYFESFGIEDSRRLKDMQSKKSLNGGKKIFIIYFDFITIEAQNSLLKMFEEPSFNTHFFIITPSIDNLLPTLKSRLMVFSSKSEADEKNNIQKIAQDFISSNVAERLEIVKKFLDEKDKIEAIYFLENIEKSLREKTPPEKMREKEIFIFEELFKAKSYLHDRSASVKLILEHIALIV